MLIATRPPRIPIRDILVRAFHPPIRERAFWAVQAMVVIWALVHIVFDLNGSLESSVVPGGAPIDLLLVPIGYAALRYGLSGSAATTSWAILLWLPDLLLSDDKGHPYQDLVQLAIVAAVALFVGLEIERAHLERARAEAAEADRRAAELHYHQLFDTNTSPILLVDLAGFVAEANPAAIELWGIAMGSSTEDLLGIKGEDLFEGRSPQTVLLEPEFGEERMYRLSVSRLETTGDDSFRQIVLEDVTEERRSENEARAWASQVLRAQEEERLRIAREIHDDPLQRLLQLARHLEALGSPAHSAEDVAQFGTVRDELLNVVGHLRDVTRGLRPAGLDQLGLVAAVRGLLVDIEMGEDLATEFTVTGDVAVGTPEAEVGMFRIIQEAVRNVVHHARAGRLSVDLAYDNDVMRVVVSDDGCGFDQATFGPVAGGHLGMLGMRERASLLGGHCNVLSALGHGTVVEAMVPLERTDEQEATRTTNDQTFTPLAHAGVIPPATTLVAGNTEKSFGERRGRPLLLQDFVDIPRPLKEIRGRFTGDGSWLAPLASAAARDGETLRMRIGPSWATGRATLEVRVTLGPLRDRGDALIIPLSWDASQLRSLVPSLKGGLELAPLGKDSCRLALVAYYVPPLGDFGTHLDHALMHRVAWSTVRAFLSRISSNLEASDDSPASPTMRSD